MKIFSSIHYLINLLTVYTRSSKVFLLQFVYKIYSYANGT
uniref:Uncharacterized protein n=1 Tax=Glaucocystis sp. BBH TaxID=2023628 RepID=A0A3G1IV57_9EUKA|nr:hypothetical protein [Glaucocystis sp. BBH]